MPRTPNETQPRTITSRSQNMHQRPMPFARNQNGPNRQAGQLKPRFTKTWNSLAGCWYTSKINADTSMSDQSQHSKVPTRLDFPRLPPHRPIQFLSATWAAIVFVPMTVPYVFKQRAHNHQCMPAEVDRAQMAGQLNGGSLSFIFDLLRGAGNALRKVASD